MAKCHNGQESQTRKSITQNTLKKLFWSCFRFHFKRWAESHKNVKNTRKTVKLKLCKNEKNIPWLSTEVMLIGIFLDIKIMAHAYCVINQKKPSPTKAKKVI